MYNYTTETILNDLTKVKFLMGGLSLPATTEYDWDPGIEAGKKSLVIEHLNKFIVGGTYDAIVTSKVYWRAATTAIQAVRQVTIPTLVTGTIYKLGVYIDVKNGPDGQFARDRTTYGKPFFVELVATATSSTTAATALKDAWNKNFAQYVNFPVATSSGADLIFTSVNNPYLWFNTFTFESISVATDSIGIATPIAVTISAGTTGKPAFGDYLDVVKNHRLPTIDNYRPFGLNQEELPIPGATYDQYTFEYLATRGEMDQTVVGGQASSKTTHIFWVNNAAARVTRHCNGATALLTGSYNFPEFLKALGLSIITASTGVDYTASVATIVEA